jgi:hypothetical protein
MNGVLRATLMLGISGSACTPAPRPGDVAKAAVTAPRPRLTRVVPDSVRIVTGNVTEIELQGANLDVAANIVRIGPIELTQIRSTSSGTRITVAIPDAIPSGGEAPPARWLGGRYPVSIQTPAGRSDTLTIIITTAGSVP